jgi:hypothetical protein
LEFPRWIHGGRDSMHNHGSQGTWLEFHRVINADRASMMQSPAGRDSMQFPRWIPRDLVGVPSSDQRRPGRKYADVGKHWLNVCRRRQTLVERRQTPGRDSMHNHGSMGRKYAQPWIHGDLVGVPSSDPWAGTRCTTMDPWASMMHNLGSQGRKYAQPWIPGDLVGVPSMDPMGASMMHNLGSMGQHDAQPWIPRPEVCRRRQTLVERMQTSANRAG